MKQEEKNLVTFHEGFSPSEEVMVNFKKMEIQMQQISNKEAFLEVFPSIKQWSVGSLYVSDTINKINRLSKKLILFSIQQIHFTRLKTIILELNNIESIQNINKIDIPTVQALCFGRNNICQLRIVRKGNWPNLNMFQTFFNPISQHEQLSQLQMPNVYHFFVDYDHTPQNKTRSRSLKWILKVQSQNVKTLSLDANERIAEKSFLSSMKKKSTILQSFGASGFSIL